MVSNVLDVPDLFWEEGQANVRALYDAVRDYMEISKTLSCIVSTLAKVDPGIRVGVLNEKLAVAEDLASPPLRY